MSYELNGVVGRAREGDAVDHFDESERYEETRVTIIGVDVWCD